MKIKEKNMITAEFKRTGSDRLSLVMNGHSGYSASEGDIVCAAASAILFTLIGYLSAPLCVPTNTTEVNEQGNSNKSANGVGLGLIINDIRSGYADIECGERGKEAMRMACIGLLQISEKYPACMKVRNQVWMSYICPY